MIRVASAVSLKRNCFSRFSFWVRLVFLVVYTRIFTIFKGFHSRINIVLSCICTVICLLVLEISFQTIFSTMLSLYLLCTKFLKYHNKQEYTQCTQDVSMEHNSKRDKRDELHNNSLKIRGTSTNYPNTFIYPNRMFLSQ
jgi:hypothetical protein